MKPVYVIISYFDALQGGAGQVSIDLFQLAQWLVDHPGCLVRAIQMPLVIRG